MPANDRIEIVFFTITKILYQIYHQYYNLLGLLEIHSISRSHNLYSISIIIQSIQKISLLEVFIYAAQLQPIANLTQT